MKPARRLRAAVVACGLAMAVTGIGFAHTVPLLYRPIVPALSKTHIRVLLPHPLPAFMADWHPLYAQALTVTPRSYDVTVGWTPACGTVTACNLMEVAAAPARRGRLAGRRVRLRSGALAYYQQARCGANCPPVEVDWVSGSVHYTVLFKGTIEQALAVANAMKPIP